MIVAILCLWGASPLAAHPMPNSVVNLDFGYSEVRLQVIMPAAELRYAFENVVPPREGAALAAQDARLRLYILLHIGARSLNGRPWSASVDRVERSTDGGPLDIITTMHMTPPAGASARDFILHDDAVTHEVVSHVILVFARSDVPEGRMDESATLIGAIQHPVTDLRIDRAAASGGGGFKPAFLLGMRHIAGGTDHLLFLLALLLPAPLLSSRGRWTGRRTTRGTIRHLALIVSSFTLGHSVTLVLGALTGLRLPQPPIEMAIAVSIMIAASQAWRPLFGEREPAIAFGFGLVHGLSFAAVIGQYVMSPWLRAEAVLGFNLGIETVQLGIVLVFAAPLVWLARSWSYSWVRIAGASVAALSSTWWCWQRGEILLDGSSGPSSSIYGLTVMAAVMLTLMALIGILLWAGLVRRGQGLAT